MEKHELSKIEFEIIDDALKALLQSRPDPLTAGKIADLRDMFRDAYPAGWKSSRPHKRCEGQKSESASRKARG